jgi:hypothetical protein
MCQNWDFWYKNIPSGNPVSKRFLAAGKSIFGRLSLWISAYCTFHRLIGTHKKVLNMCCTYTEIQELEEFMIKMDDFSFKARQVQSRCCPSWRTRSFTIFCIFKRGSLAISAGAYEPHEFLADLFVLHAFYFLDFYGSLFLGLRLRHLSKPRWLTLLS